MPRKFFKEAKKGQQPSASEHNKLTRSVSELMAYSKTNKTYSKVRLGKLDEVMGTFLINPSDQQIDRQLSFRFWNRGTDTFDAGDRAAVSIACDPFDLVYDQDEYLLFFYSEQGSKFIPVNPRTVRHAITCRDQSNNYPDRSVNPDTYPIRWVKLVYAEAGGRQGHTLTYLNADNTSGANDDWVHNIIDPDLFNAYIPEGTLIECYNVTRQWFTMYTGESEDSSESVSFSSFSSSSNSSSNSSSKSSSNSSSESASNSVSSSDSSASSSESSASSLSASSSQSSQSVSDSSGGSSASSSVSISDSSGGSSVSVSESSGYECVSVVDSVCFNSGTCTLTITCKQICFPKTLGITTGAGDCAAC